jgi:hypothetical protein
VHRPADSCLNVDLPVGVCLLPTHWAARVRLSAKALRSTPHGLHICPWAHPDSGTVLRLTSQPHLVLGSRSVEPYARFAILLRVQGCLYRVVFCRLVAFQISLLDILVCFALELKKLPTGHGGLIA